MPRIKPGDKAPDFAAESINKGILNLNEFKGNKTLLNFSRYFGCPVCQLEFDELREFMKKHSDLKVIYVNQSFPESAKKFIEGKNVDFPIITSQKTNGKYELYDLYGVGNLGVNSFIGIFQKAKRARSLGKEHGLYEGKETQSPAQFLIDEEGRVFYANYGLFNLVSLERALNAR